MDTTTSRDEFLTRVYSREKAIEPAERTEPRFWDSMKEANEEAPRGKGRFFRVKGALSHSSGTPSEGGDWSDSYDPEDAECSVTSAQMDNSVSVSMKFLAASEDDGSYSGSGESEKIADAILELFQFADILMGCGHGTGRLAIVSANSGPSTTVTLGCDLDTPESVFQLRRKQPIEFVDLDTGGTVQATTTIEDIDYDNHQITTSSNVTVVAGWGVYQKGTYGKPKPNGLRVLVDDGSFSANYCNKARTDAPFLNAVVKDGNGGLQNFSEELMDDLIDTIGNTGGTKNIPTEIRSNQGLANENKRIIRESREFTVTDGGAVKGTLGGKTTAYVYNGTKIPWEVDRNLPARELFALYRPGFRKHTLRKADWESVAGSKFLQKVADGGGTYSHALVANIMMDLTISHRRPYLNGVLRNVRDRTSAKDI